MISFIRNFAASCTTEPSFFGFPTWYKYLIKENKIDSTCKLVDFELIHVWLIVYAII